MDQTQDGYITPYWHRQKVPLMGQTSSTWGAYARQNLMLSGSALRFIDNPDLAITGNDSVFAGIAGWATSFAGGVMGFAGPGTGGEYTRMIDEAVDQAYSSALTGVFGYTPVQGAYQGPVPDAIGESKTENFLFRINAEATVEGRRAILYQVQQEKKDKEALSRASIAKLLGIGLLSLPFDESFWIDLYVTKGAMKFSQVQQMARLHKIVSVAGIGAMGAGVSGGIREAVLYKGQFTRTPEEVLQAIKVEAAFGGLMGAAVATLGSSYRAATRARYGADTIHDAVITAQDNLTRNLMNNPRLQRKMTGIMDAFNAGREVDPARLDSVLDEYLDGANRNIVELIGMRRGSWGNSLVNKFFFLTPNIRFATSSLTKPRQFIDMLTDTGLAKSGTTSGASLERLKILMEGYQDMSRMEMGDILRVAREEGANIRSDEAFDTAVEMTYRRDPTNVFDVPERITYSDVQGNQTINVMGTDEPLNTRARKAIKDAATKFSEEQKVYDSLAIDSGQFGYDTMQEIRKMYKEVHGENFVHRIIDRQVVFDDREGAIEAVISGFRDLKAKKEPELTAKINAAQNEIDRLELARASGADSNQVDELISLAQTRKSDAETTLASLEPNYIQAEKVVANWMEPIDGVIKPSIGTAERSILIKDEFIEPYLIKSVDAQRSAWFRNTGIRGVAFNKLASAESKQYVTRTREISVELEDLERQLRDSTNSIDVDRLQSRIKELAEEQDVLVQTSRLSSDMRLASRMSDVELRGNLQKVRNLKDSLLQAISSGDKDAFNTAKMELNTVSSEFVGTYRITDAGKSDGNILEHTDLKSFRVRTNPFESYDDRVLGSLDLDPRVYQLKELIDSIRAEGGVMRDRLTKLETGDNQKNRLFRFEASMEREVAEGGYQKKQVKELKRHAKDLQVVHERIMGTRGYDSGELMSVLGPVMRNYNYMTSMGSVTLSSFPDIAMGVFTAGLGPYLATTFKYARHVTRSALSEAAPDHKFYQLDLVHSLEACTQGARVRQMMAVDRSQVQAFGRRRKAFRQQLIDLSAQGSEQMTRYTLLGQWNGFWKAVNNGAAASRVGRIADKLGSGRNISGGDKRFLERLKLDEADVLDMDKLYKEFGESETTGMGSRFHYAKSQLWNRGAAGLSDSRVFELKSKLNSSLSMNSDMSIITPGAGSIPSIVDNSEGSNLVFQFKRYFFTATENLLIPMAQRAGTGDMQALMTGAGLMVAGAIVTAAKSEIKGQDPFPHLNLDGSRKKTSTKKEYYDNIVALTFNAMDRSGILGIMTEPLSISSKLGYDPISVLTGSEEKLGRAQSKPVSEMLVGPSLGKIQTLFDATTSAIGILRGTEPLTAAGTKDFMAMIPYQNLLPFTMIANVGFNAMQASDSAATYNRMFPDAPAKDASDFYYDQFKFIEHRLAPLFAPVDYTGYDPKTAIVQ